MRVNVYIRKENEERWEEVCATVGGSEWVNLLLKQRIPSGNTNTAKVLSGKQFKKPIQRNVDGFCKHGFSLSARLCKHGCR